MNEDDQLYLVVAVFSSLSLLGSLFIITIYAKFEALHCFSFKLVVILSIFHCVEYTFQLMPTHVIKTPYSICMFQATMIQFSSLAGALWIGCMSFLLYLQVIKKITDLQFYLNICLVFTIGLCLTTSIIPLITSSYGYVGGNCWISGKSEAGNIFRYVFFFGITWIIILFNSLLYFKIIQKVKVEMSIKNKLMDEGKVLIHRLRLYPIAMIVTYAPLTIVRILESMGNDLCPTWFYMTAYAFFTSNGLFNSIIYGLNDSVKQQIYESLSKNDVDLSSLNTFTSSSF